MITLLIKDLASNQPLYKETDKLTCAFSSEAFSIPWSSMPQADKTSISYLQDLYSLNYLRILYQLMTENLHHFQVIG